MAYESERLTRGERFAKTVSAPPTETAVNLFKVILERGKSSERFFIYMIRIVLLLTPAKLPFIEAMQKKRDEISIWSHDWNIFLTSKKGKEN